MRPQRVDLISGWCLALTLHLQEATLVITQLVSCRVAEKSKGPRPKSPAVGRWRQTSQFGAAEKFALRNSRTRPDASRGADRPRPSVTTHEAVSASQVPPPRGLRFARSGQAGRTRTREPCFSEMHPVDGLKSSDGASSLPGAVLLGCPGTSSVFSGSSGLKPARLHTARSGRVDRTLPKEHNACLRSIVEIWLTPAVGTQALSGFAQGRSSAHRRLRSRRRLSPATCGSHS